MTMDDEDEIEVTEEILSFHSNVRENIVSLLAPLLHLKVGYKNFLYWLVYVGQKRTVGWL